MSDNEFEERYGALKEIIQKEIQALPPENAKARIKLYLENIAELFISLPVEELTQKFSEIFLENTRADGEANNEKLPKVRGVHADSFFAPVDALTKAILGCDDKFNSDSFMRTQNDDDPDSLDLDSDSELKKFCINKKLYVLVNLRYEDMPEALQSKIANRRTRAVHDAMTSLILAGNKYITLQQIAGHMNGYSKTRKSTEAFLKEIEHEADWLIHTWATINATNEAKARGYNFKEVKFNSPLIPAKSVEVINNAGQRVKAYKIWEIPVLYAYAKQKDNAITVPIDYVALPDNVNTTFDNIILRNYLIEQIEAMSLERIGNVILYETLYKVAGIQETSRTEKKRFRETVKILLDNWVERGYIQSYFEEPRNVYDESGKIKNTRVAKVRIIITPYLRKKLKE